MTDTLPEEPVASLPDVNIAGRNASTDGACAGNPVMLATGNKVEFEVDFQVPSNDGLSLARTYNHYSNQAFGIFGTKWTTNHDYNVMFGDYEPGACTINSHGYEICDKKKARFILAVRPDGRNLKYVRDGSGVYRPELVGSNTFMFWDQQSNLVYHAENNEIERYGRDWLAISSSYISERKNQLGDTWAYEGEAWQINKITHSSGRYIQFFWSSGKLTAVRDSSGSFHGYAYRWVEGKDPILVAHTQSDTSISVVYHYENNAFPNALTGKSIAGVRYSAFAYDASGRVASTEHAGGVDRHTFNYSTNENNWCDESGCYSSPATQSYTHVTNPLGKIETYIFEAGRQVGIEGAAATYCPASSRSTTYDANGRIDRETDANGNITDLDYDEKGRLIKRVEAYGTSLARTTLYTWDANQDRIFSVTLPGQHRTEYAYHPDGRIASVAVINLSSHGLLQSVQTTTYVYTRHANGLVAAMTVDGPLAGTSDAVISTYSVAGDLISQRNGLNHEVIYSGHNGRGQPSRIVGANGETVDFSYDALGRTILYRRWIGGTAFDTSYTYDARGHVVLQTTPDGVGLHQEFDSARRLKRIWRASSALGPGATHEEVLFSYDLMGNVVKQLNRKLQNGVWLEAASETVDYDELGRVRAKRGNNGGNVRYAYDPDGNLKTVTDSLNGITTLTYDALGRVISSADPLNGLTRYEYDTAGRVSKVTDARNLAKTYIHDGFGQLWAQHSPDTGTTSFRYNVSGQKDAMWRNDGSWLAYVYDSLGRLVWYGNYEAGRAFGYDWCPNGKGRLCNADTNEGAHHYAYTQFGEISGELEWTPAAGDYTGYSYDVMGRLTGIAYPSGVSVGYGYASGRLTNINMTMPNGVAHTVASNVQYEPFAGISKWTYGNGLIRSMLYDSDGRLTAIATPGVQDLRYTYDANNRITQIQNVAYSSLTQTYSYDPLSRLTGMVAAGANESIQYDATGNRTLHNWLAPISNEVDASSNRINKDFITVASTGIIYGHDTRGNRSSQSWGGSTATYAYGAFNELKSVSRTAASSYSNGGYVMATYPAGTTHYRTNALGQRVAKSNSATSSRYSYIGQNRLLAEINNGAWISHIWLGGIPVGVVKGNELYAVHTDQLARPEVVTNSVQQTVWRAKNYHSERGVVLDSIGGYNLGFPGQYYDSETGLWYNGFRYYDSRLGRYTQSDPIGLQGGINTYAYVEGNPLTSFDLLGLDGGSLYTNPNTMMAVPKLTDCEAEATSDFMINLTSFGAYVQTGMDVLGVDVDLVGSRDVDFFEYDEIDTPAAAAGHLGDAYARKLERRAANQLARSNERGVHYSVQNGRANRSAVSRARAAVARRGAGLLGPYGAVGQWALDLRKCECKRK